MKYLILAGIILGGGSTLPAQVNFSTPYTFTTLAGTAGAYGSVDGTGAAARFENPAGIAIDANGNVYVADLDANVIRKITPGGVVTTLAGQAGSLGSADGTGSAARFDQPNGVAVDSNGNVFVADADNNTIRKITPGGVVTTLAGSPGAINSTDGTGSAARFWFPSSIAIDSNNNLYVADTGNGTIRKVTSAGVVTTLAGNPAVSGSADGTGSAATFNYPSGVAVDASGANIYVADSGNNTIRKITSAGVATTIAGSAAAIPAEVDGTGTAARFAEPVDVAVDASGTIYVADIYGCTMRKITSAGVVTTLAGTATTTGSSDGTGPNAGFSFPGALTVDANRRLYVVDSMNSTIRYGFAGGPLYFQNGTVLNTLALGPTGPVTGATEPALQPTLANSDGVTVGAMQSGWQLRAVADVNGDGVQDLIFQNGTLVGALIMNSVGNPGSWVGIGAMQPGWQLRAAIGAASSGGSSQLFFQNAQNIGMLTVSTAGAPVLWTGIGGMNSGWILHAVAVSADGHPFLLFQNSTLLGALQVSTSGSPVAWIGIGSMNAGWTLSLALDIDDDGQSDLIFQNGTVLGVLRVNSSYVPQSWTNMGTLAAGLALPGDF